MEHGFTTDEWEACLKVLNILKNDPFNNPDNLTFKTLVTDIYRQAKKQQKREARVNRRLSDVEILQQTVIAGNAAAKTTDFVHNAQQNPDVFINELASPAWCYCCSEPYTRVHFFYHKLCPACALENYEKRSLSPNLFGYTAVVTGGRVKIGYATVLTLLNLGATVVLTTRFPALALKQLQQEQNYDDFKERVLLYGLDLRNLKAVEDFVLYCHRNFSQIDILINNAAQTIKYPTDYYTPLIAGEQQLLATKQGNLFPNGTPVTGIELLPGPGGFEFPVNRFGQPVDYRDKNSWNSELTDIGLEELLEVNLINHIAPYRLIAGLKPLMKASAHPKRFVVNVTSSEGQFSYTNKTKYHPHTNMTKAALNMLTRTSAEEFSNDGIYMTAVDVGWVSTGVGEQKRERLFSDMKMPPLDPVDGAMRIIHPIYESLYNNNDFNGVLLKNYKVVDW
ncbi:SDR family NAD(P)-dependent oxidoreductase [Flavobacterium sp. RNTU_13]|uniref:SDR family NAD(P)-dependent oxidoreductase n=1 Tax=Flavobacterium sp. RNTU_13 TaxID=3375145 RepID=UPI003987B348